MSRPAIPLAQMDALPMAHALCAWLGKVEGVRLLGIKGPSAEFHGLRAPRVSADVDVLVEPQAVDRFTDALRIRGWAPRQASWLASEVVTHSVTLVHADWPCDIDLHHVFPGFLAEPDEVFDALWTRREVLQQARTDMFVPDRSGAILVGALHALRTPAQTPRHAHEIARLVEVSASLSKRDREDIVALADLMGAADTARPFLLTLDVGLPPPLPYGANSALDDWRVRVAADAVFGVQVWLSIRRRVWWRWPRDLLRVLWPSQEDFRRDHPEMAQGTAAALRGRLARLGRGAGQLRAISRGGAAARRGATQSSLIDGREV